MKNKFENLPELVANKLVEFESTQNCKVLYLTEYGSKLYGTDNENSDTDFKGIFIPNINSVLLGKSKDSFEFSTGSNDSKNQKEDFDVGLLSLQRFLTLLKKSETTSTGLLFSMFAPSVVFEEKSFTSFIKENHKKLICSNVTSHMGFAIGQMKNFSLKTDRLEEIRNLNKIMKDLKLTDKEKSQKLSTKIELLREITKNFKYLGVQELPSSRNSKNSKNSNEEINYNRHNRYLKVFSKCFEETITISHLLKELKKQEKGFGNRTRDNLNKNGKVDLKGLSHGLRIAFECQELMKTGFVTFPMPLHNRKLVRAIKFGEMDLEKAKDLVLRNLDEVPKCSLESNLPENLDEEFLDTITLKFFKLFG